MTIGTERRSWLREGLSALTSAAAVVLWRPQREAHYDSPACAPAIGDAAGRSWIQHVAAHDLLLGSYLAILLGSVLTRHGPYSAMATRWLILDFVVFLAIVAVVRGTRRSGLVWGLLYRASVLVALLGSFSQLQWILPAASGAAVDGELHALDLRLFHVEPAVSWDQFVRPPVTEWFSFFYFGYFILIGVHIFPSLLFGRRDRLMIPFGFGFLWLYCVGHIAYTIVPAYGPYHALHFQHSLDGPRWWPLVKATVAVGSVRTDVFPSLHTAAPTFIALFSFVERRALPYRYTWFPVAFCATQIVIATMFLRWHYLIDICAGIVLAVSGVVMGRLVLEWENARVGAGGPPAWPPLR